MSDQDGPRGAKSGPGVHSLAEILSQPHCWGNCLKELEKKGFLEKIIEPFSAATEWLFVGCGSSYYIALAAAASWSMITGQRARAVPASELLLFPNSVVTETSVPVAVVISRSGRTSEALRAAEMLEGERDIRTLAVTCTGDQPLEHISTSTLALLPADEESTVMTRSFTSMLLGLQYLAACVAGDHALAKNLRRLPMMAQGTLHDLQTDIREFVTARHFVDYVCLGQGPFYGLACEAALKVTEMSVSYAQSFHTLEFRHGPKSIVTPETLILFLLSESGYEAECEVLQEIKSLGGTTLVIANRADERVRAHSDLLIELGLELPELARLAAYVFGGQFVGLYTGLKRGLDPDHPRNLSRVVILDED